LKFQEKNVTSKQQGEVTVWNFNQIKTATKFEVHFSVEKGTRILQKGIFQKHFKFVIKFLN
jgi:hypothetical protein